MCGEACVADDFLPWVFEVFVPTLSAETRGRMRELLCDTASFVVRSFVRWQLDGAAACRVLRLRKIIDDASGFRLADNRKRNMQIRSTNGLN